MDQSGPEADLQQIAARVPDTWIPELDRIARVRRWSRAEVIREAIRQFIGVPTNEKTEAKAS